MLVLHNTIRDYAWGSATLLAQLQGRRPTGRPEAELWMGAHPGAPSQVQLPDDDAPLTLDAHLERHPGLLGRASAHGHLPFLVKLLAAGRPLSLQVHPTTEQAKAGFAAEERAGVPVDSPQRNYRDEHHKPEMILALTPFTALCGFRPIQESARAFERLAQVLTEHHDGAASPEAASAAHLSMMLDAGRLQDVLETLLDPTAGWSTAGWVDTAVAALRRAPQALDSDLALATAVGIAEHFPGDPGVLVSLLLHRVDLAPGQAIFLPAGNMHAYLHGLGLEVMASSDNVLRCGLTPKHVDVPELLEVLDCQPLPVPYLNGTANGPGRQVFAPAVEEFVLERLDLPAAEGQSVASGEVLDAPMIVVCTAGGVLLETAEQSVVLGPGESVFLGAGEAAPTVHLAVEDVVARAGADTDAVDPASEGDAPMTDGTDEDSPEMPKTATVFTVTFPES